MEITPDKRERAEGALSPLHLEQAATTIRTDGYVVINDIVAHDHLDQLRERMDRDAQLLYDANQWSGAGGLPGHLMLGPPPFEPFVFNDIVANPFAIQVSQAILGDRFFNGFYCGNTNCPGSHRCPEPPWVYLQVLRAKASRCSPGAQGSWAQGSPRTSDCVIVILH